MEATYTITLYRETGVRDFQWKNCKGLSWADERRLAFERADGKRLVITFGVNHTIVIEAE